MLNNVKTGIIILLLYSFSYNGFCQNNNISNKNDIVVGTFIEELYKFINNTNREDSLNCKYFIYDIYVYPLKNENNCIGYTVGYIYNYYSYYDISPQYYFSDSLNIITVNFNSQINNKSILGLKLNKIDNYNKSKILSKLIPKGNSLSGVDEAFTYYTCGNKKEMKFYNNTLNLPKDKTIYRNLNFDNIKQGEIKNFYKEDSLKK